MGTTGRPSEKSLRRLSRGSARRWAVSQELEARGYAPWRRAIEPPRSWLAQAVSRHAFLVGAASLLILLGLPINIGFLVFGDAAEASEWLRTMWQVEAAALALSLTIMVFALEIFGRSGVVRYGGTLKAFAQTAGLVRAFRLGVIALLIDGAVLAGIGHQAPGGWAAFVASLVSGCAIVALPCVMDRVLRDTDTARLREVRTSAFRQAVVEAVRTQVTETFARAELQRIATAEDFDVHLMFAPDLEPGQVEIKAPRSGTVRDINVDQLTALAGSVRALGRVSLRVRIGVHVGTESTLLVLPPGTDAQARDGAKRVVRLAPRAPDVLSGHLDQLHDDALVAIRQRQPAMYDDIADSYVATLMEFPVAWAAYRQEYDANVASGIDVIPIGPIEQIQRALYEELNLAAEGNREIMFAAAALPARVILRALDVNASGLLPTMLGLHPQMYVIGASAPGEVADLLKERSWTHLNEILRFGIRPRLDDASPEMRLRALGEARQVFLRFGALLRLAADRGDVEGLKAADAAWDSSLRHWFAPASVDSSEVEFLEAEVARGENVEAELNQARTRLEIATAARDLDSQKTALRFALAAWVWRRHREPIPNWAELLSYLASRLGSVSQASSAVTAALSVEHESTHGPLSDWIMDEQGEGVHTIAPEGDLFAVFAAIALMRLSAEEPPPRLEASSWMAQYENDVTSAIDRVAADERLKALGVANGSERAAVLKDAIAEGASAYREAEAAEVREAPLHDPFVAEFEDEALKALVDSRLAANLLRYAGAVEREAGPPPKPEDVTVMAYINKELFIGGGRMVGRDWTARDFGSNIAARETQTFVQMLAETERAAVDQESIDVALDAAVRTMAEDGYSPTIALFPINFRLLRQLGLPFGSHDLVLPPDLHLGDTARSGFRGLLDDLLVFQIPDVPDDRTYLLDAGRFAKAHEWVVAPGDRMRVELIDEVKAEEIVATWPPPGPNETVSSRVRDLMGQVLATACLDISIEITDQHAARWVGVPESLRRK